MTKAWSTSLRATVCLPSRPFHCKWSRSRQLAQAVRALPLAGSQQHRGSKVAAATVSSTSTVAAPPATVKPQGDTDACLSDLQHRNGPGQFRMGEDEYGHPFDGDGVVVSVAFKDGRAFFRSRFVETPELQAERAAGKVLYRGAFSAERAGGWRDNALNLHLKNASNTGVALWGGNLYSLFEASLPYRLDPSTLQTHGLETLGGRLKPGLICAIEGSALPTLLTVVQRAVGHNHILPPEWLQPGGHACTAHAYTCATTGRLCFFTYQFTITDGGLALAITFWELDPASGAIHSQQEFLMPRGNFVHDFTLTPNYYVLFQSPTTIDVAAYVLGHPCPASCLSWLPDTPTYVHLIPRPGSPASRLAPHPRTLPMPTSFPLHQANAYEVPVTPREGTEAQQEQLPAAVVVDAIHYETLPALGRQAFEQSPDPGASFLGQLRRAHIDLAAGDVSLSEPLSGHLEMPSVDPAIMGAPHRYVYGYTARPEALALALSKVDTATATSATYCPPPCTFFGQPIFVARPGATAEDDGWLVAIAFNSEKLSSQVLVLDAQRVEEGPIAVLAVPNALPHGLHNIWTPEYFGPHAGSTTSQARKECDMQ